MFTKIIFICLRTLACTMVVTYVQFLDYVTVKVGSITIYNLADCN